MELERLRAVKIYREWAKLEARRWANIREGVAKLEILKAGP